MKSSVLLLAGLLISFVRLGYADDGAYVEYPQSGTVCPVKNNNIKMVSEEVIFKDNKITATFEFLNTTDNQQEVTVGFPVIGQFHVAGDGSSENEFSEERSVEDRKKDIIKYYDFKSIIDGQEIKRELIELSREYPKEGYEYVFVTNIKFHPRQKIIIKDVYNQQTNYGSEVGGRNISELDYVLKTGASWKDKIDHAKIIFYIPASQTYYVFSPSNLCNKFSRYYFTSNIPPSKASDKMCEWDFNDFKPNEDLHCEWGSSPVGLGWDFNKLTADIIRQDGAISDEYKVFILEMQNESTFYSYIKALAQAKLYIQSPGKGQTWEDYYIKELENINCRFIINSLFALKGYKFSNPGWSEFYKQFRWYKPFFSEAKIKGNSNFNDQEKTMLANLQRVEDKEDWIRYANGFITVSSDTALSEGGEYLLNLEKLQDLQRIVDLSEQQVAEEKEIIRMEAELRLLEQETARCEKRDSEVMDPKYNNVPMEQKHKWRGEYEELKKKFESARLMLDERMMSFVDGLSSRQRERFIIWKDNKK